MLDGHSGMPSMFWMSRKWRKANLKKHFALSLSLFYLRWVICLHVLWKRTFSWPRLDRKEVRRFLSPLILQTFPYVLLSDWKKVPLFVSFCQQLSWNGKKDLHLTLDVQHMRLSVLKKKAERNWFWCHLNICKVDVIWYLSDLCKKMAIAIICSNWLPYYCNIHMIIVQQSLETKAIFS